LGLEAQRQAVMAHLRDVSPISEFTEIETGTRADRPQLAAALAACRVHRAVLIIAKLDRLARNVAFVSSLMDSGVEFLAVDFPQANRLTIHVMAAFAEHEAKMISERTRAALAAAKARGRLLGGFRGRAGTCTDLGREPINLPG
jgi:DNA invertase Pin-like site-specific DNA recombinase